MSIIENEFSILLRNEEWICRYQRSPRRKRTISLQVIDEKTLLLQAPIRSSERKLKEWVRQKEDWIYAQLDEIKKKAATHPPLPKFYTTGAVQRFIGHVYPLEWVKCPHRDKKVVLSQDRIWVLAPTNEVTLLQRLLSDWYRKEAVSVLEKEISDWSGILPWVKRPPSFTIRNIRSRWGSCSHRGTLSFNLHLLKFPIEIISYIVCHELCHLKEMNHSADFYALLDQYLPEWETYRKFLHDFKEKEITLF